MTGKVGLIVREGGSRSPEFPPAMHLSRKIPQGVQSLCQKTQSIEERDPGIDTQPARVSQAKPSIHREDAGSEYTA